MEKDRSRGSESMLRSSMPRVEMLEDLVLAPCERCSRNQPIWQSRRVQAHRGLNLRSSCPSRVSAITPSSRALKAPRDRKETALRLTYQLLRQPASKAAAAEALSTLTRRSGHAHSASTLRKRRRARSVVTSRAIRADLRGGESADKALSSGGRISRVITCSAADCASGWVGRMT